MLSELPVISVPVPRFVHRGVPSYFRASCQTASFGGDDGYFTVGRTLASHVAGEVPYGLEDDEWFVEVETLETLLADNNDALIWQWLKVYLPRFMALIPTRRKARFIAGMKDIFQEEYRLIS